MNNIFIPIASSSAGNCYIYNQDLMIDIGVTYKKVKPYLKSIKIILLTHIHSDHINKTTLKKTLFEYPNIKIVCCWWLVELLINLGIPRKNMIVLELEKKYDFKKYIIEPVPAIHDVPNCGYKIIIKGINYKIFHISDTTSVNHIEAKDYDLCSIEANYLTEEELDKKIEQDKLENKYSHYERVKNTHLSQLQALNWIQKNNIKDYCFIHQHRERREERC